MLFPYRRTFPSRGRWAVDRWTSRGWRVLERHEVRVAAPPDEALRALAGLRLFELPAVRALFALRRLPCDPLTSLLEFFSTQPFVLLDEVPGKDLVAGILVPARGEGGTRRQPATREEFERALGGAPVAAIAAFRADPADGGARLSTETLVRVRGRWTRAGFGAYWLAIGPFSAWIRRMFLSAARARAEAAAAHPGDRRSAVRR